jgi:hypothetical protein
VTFLEFVCGFSVVPKPKTKLPKAGGSAEGGELEPKMANVEGAAGASAVFDAEVESLSENESDDDVSERSETRGARSNYRFSFPPFSPLHHTHEIMTKSKLFVPILCGMPPLRSPQSTWAVASTAELTAPLMHSTPVLSAPKAYLIPLLEYQSLVPPSRISAHGQSLLAAPPFMAAAYSPTLRTPRVLVSPIQCTVLTWREIVLKTLIRGQTRPQIVVVHAISASIG